MKVTGGGVCEGDGMVWEGEGDGGVWDGVLR